MQELAKAIDALEFGATFRIVNGSVVETKDYAPEVFNAPNGDITIDGGWTTITGFTGQYGYNGAVMHPSEFVGTLIADHLAYLATGDDSIVFAIVTVDDIDGYEPVGWTIAYRN